MTTLSREWRTLGTYPQAATVVDGRLERYPGDEHPVGPVRPVALADVQPQGLAGPLHDLHQLMVEEEEEEKLKTIKF